MIALAIAESMLMQVATSLGPELLDEMAFVGGKIRSNFLHSGERRLPW